MVVIDHNDTSLVTVMRDSLEGCVLEYDSLKGEVKKLFGNYDTLERQVVALRSPFHKMYVRTRNKVLGKENPSVDEIIRFQEVLVNGLVSELSSQLQRTERSLSALAGYSDILESRVFDAVSSRGVVSSDIETLKKDIDICRRELAGLSKTDPVYYQKRKALKDKVRTLRSISNSYNLANESIRDNLVINNNVLLREELLRVSSEYAHSLVEASSRYAEFLGVIRGVYSDFLRQSKLYGALFNTVSRSREFISALDRIVVNGQAQILQIANTTHSNDSSALLDGAVSRANEFSDSRTRSLDASVDGYLK